MAIIKSIVRNIFPHGGGIRFRKEKYVYEYEHFLKDKGRSEYIHSLPRTLKDKDISVEITLQDGIEKAYWIKKYFDPDIQKDIWDILILHDREIRTKFSRKAKQGQNFIEGRIIGAESEASNPVSSEK